MTHQTPYETCEGSGCWLDVDVLAFDSGYIGRGRGRLLLYCPPAAVAPPPPSALWSTDLCTRIGSVRLCLVNHIYVIKIGSSYSDLIQVVSV